MASELTIPTILKIGKLSQVLFNVNNQKDTLFKGATIDPRRPRTIYEVWKPLSLRYAANPNDPTIRQMAEYLYLLSDPQAQQILNNLNQGTLTISGPSNQSVLVGATANFTIVVTSALPYTVQWFLNGVAIPGATGTTYSKTNSQLTDSGGVFTAQVTNGGAPVTSNTATLTVTASLVALTWYGDTDPATDLQANIDNFSYQITTNITHNAAISIAIPQVATPNKYFVTKVSIGESVKTTWFNTPTNQGTFSSDFNYQNPIQFGGFTYYYSRQALSMDYTQPLVLS